MVKTDRSKGLRTRLILYTVLLDLALVAFAWGGLWVYESVLLNRDAFKALNTPSSQSITQLTPVSLSVSRDGTASWSTETCDSLLFQVPRPVTSKTVKDHGLCHLRLADGSQMQVGVLPEPEAAALLRQPWPPLSGVGDWLTWWLPQRPFQLTQQALYQTGKEPVSWPWLPGRRLADRLTLLTKHGLLQGFLLQPTARQPQQKLYELTLHRGANAAPAKAFQIGQALPGRRFRLLAERVDRKPGLVDLQITPPVTSAALSYHQALEYTQILATFRDIPQ